MRIENLSEHQSKEIEHIAKILADAFIYVADEDKEMQMLIKKVKDSCASDRISRAMYNEKNQVIGWVGGISHYDGHVWELHPLVIASAYQKKGYGTKLVIDFEEQVRARNGITIYLGADDQWGGTSLYGQDIYHHIWEYIQNIKNLKHHPYGFYEKLGYNIVGIVPDANGLGKPDILMAKRVVPWKS